MAETVMKSQLYDVTSARSITIFALLLTSEVKQHVAWTVEGSVLSLVFIGRLMWKLIAVTSLVC